MGPSLALIALDTHVVAWMLLEPGNLSAAARKAIETADGEIGISDITLYELAAFARKGIVTRDGCRELLMSAERNFEILAITARVCTIALDFPATFPKDPADRIIAATAIAHGLNLVTADRAIRNSGIVRTIW